jgi:dUTP pyrophosphatase
MSSILNNSYGVANNEKHTKVMVCEPLECLLSPGAKLPIRAHDSDAGADLHAYFGEYAQETSITIMPGEQMLVDTGVAMKIPVGYGGFVGPRSSQRKARITSWGEGIIDSAYRGTVKVILANMGSEPYVFKHGDRIAQIVISPVVLCDFVDVWNDTARGTGGFGSTGK